MVSINDLAALYEEDLNKLVADEGWTFTVYSQTGRLRKPERDGNIVSGYVPAQLSVNTSALQANLLVMGIVYLTLEFLVPEEPLQISAIQKENPNSLYEVKDGQNYFVNHVTQIITDYFQNSTTSTVTDDEGNSFSLGQKAGIATTGIVNPETPIGRAVPVTVAIELSFVEGGTNALDIKLYIDGERIPYQSLVSSRSAALETNVHSGETAQTHWASSDVFGIDITFPSTSDTAVKRLIREFITGESINMAHFVRVVWGDIADKYYLMQVTNVQGSAEGASFAGIQMSLGQAPRDLSGVNFPSCYSVHAYTFSDSTATSVKVSLRVEITYSDSEDIPDSLTFVFFMSGTFYSVTGTLYDTYVDDDNNTLTATYEMLTTATITEKDLVDVTKDAESDTYLYYAYIAVLGIADIYKVYKGESVTSGADGVATIQKATE